MFKWLKPKPKPKPEIKETGTLLPCGHDEIYFYSICSAIYDPNCPRCKIGRCIKCIPEIQTGSRFPTFDKETGKEVNTFPNLGVRLK